jgi:hypothetical protein
MFVNTTNNLDVKYRDSDKEKQGLHGTYNLFAYDQN